jgi:hypothetical protein
MEPRCPSAATKAAEFHIGMNREFKETHCVSCIPLHSHTAEHLACVHMIAEHQFRYMRDLM